jgi:hypothetical protein
MKQKKIYGTINIIVLLISFALFVYFYSDVKTIFNKSSVETVVVVAVTAVVVQVIKTFRLYLAFQGKGLSVSQHIKQYCKVLPACILFPFKLGDVFRIYCYGYQIHSYFKSVVVILFDRFIDTLALVTMIIVIKTMGNSTFMPLFYILSIFLVGLIIGYMIFPGMYRYWKKYFLSTRASKRSNHVLRALEQFNKVYTELAEVVRGRGIILYILSLVAWGTEIGGLSISNKVFFHQGTVDAVNEYLMSALVGSEVVYLQQFIWISIVFVIVVYVCLHFKMLFNERDRRKQ